VSAGLANRLPTVRSVAQRAGYPRLKVTGTLLTGSFHFTPQFCLKNRAAGAAEFSPEFYEEERAREEP